MRAVRKPGKGDIAKERTVPLVTPAVPVSHRPVVLSRVDPPGLAVGLDVKGMSLVSTTSIRSSWCCRAKATAAVRPQAPPPMTRIGQSLNVGPRTCSSQPGSLSPSISARTIWSRIAIVFSRRARSKYCQLPPLVGQQERVHEVDLDTISSAPAGSRDAGPHLPPGYSTGQPSLRPQHGWGRLG